MLIQPGAIYWVQIAANPIPHPHVVVQADNGNDAASGTVVVCALTSNIKRVSLPGNILLESGEANLQRPSVVEVAKSVILENHQLGTYIGTLSPQRIEQILAGMRFVEKLLLLRNGL